jgi:hypothetical protein
MWWAILALVVYAKGWMILAAVNGHRARQAQHQYDRTLDYLFRTYSLNLRDPYVVRPGFQEKRCYHCFYPQERGHDVQCAWQRMQPVVQKFYAP